MPILEGDVERGQAGEAGRVRSWPRRLLAELKNRCRMDWEEARARVRRQGDQPGGPAVATAWTKAERWREGDNCGGRHLEMWGQQTEAQRQGCLLDF